MTEDDDHLLALYRSHATEEPPGSLDARILRAARRRGPLPAALMACLSLVMGAALVFDFSPQNQAPMHAHRLPPGLEDGRGRFLASDAGKQLAADSTGLYPTRE